MTSNDLLKVSSKIRNKTDNTETTSYLGPFPVYSELVKNSQRNNRGNELGYTIRILVWNLSLNLKIGDFVSLGSESFSVNHPVLSSQKWKRHFEVYV